MKHAIHADALYAVIKETLKDFGLSFQHMDDLLMEFGEEFVTFKTRDGKKQFVYSCAEINAQTVAR